jgi:hypothetical protein
MKNGMVVNNMPLLTKEEMEQIIQQLTNWKTCGYIRITSRTVNEQFRKRNLNYNQCYRISEKVNETLNH